MKATLQGFTVTRSEHWRGKYIVQWPDGSEMVGNDVPNHMKHLMANEQATTGVARFDSRTNARAVALALPRL